VEGLVDSHEGRVEGTGPIPGPSLENPIPVELENPIPIFCGQHQQLKFSQKPTINAGPLPSRGARNFYTL
jgi:hypothetical protein